MAVKRELSGNVQDKDSQHLSDKVKAKLLKFQSPVVICKLVDHHVYNSTLLVATDLSWVSSTFWPKDDA
jgi:hypothetical protein